MSLLCPMCAGWTCLGAHHTMFGWGNLYGSARLSRVRSRLLSSQPCSPIWARLPLVSSPLPCRLLIPPLLLSPPPEQGDTFPSPWCSIVEVEGIQGSRSDHTNQAPVTQPCLCLLDSILCPPLPASPHLDTCVDHLRVVWIPVLHHFSCSWYLEFLLQGFEGKLQLSR